MSKVAVLLRVLPDDAETKPEELYKKIAAALPEKYQVAQYQAEPIAFGLEALRMVILMPEETEGGTEELETIIQSVQGVSQVDVLNVTRFSG
ncbi:elongation factor 1-beta [Thermofilum pendens]|uniref:Elongation factor 1-beta n=1 Tax=Thermofilum pendens (strain DSM 2475 / Hrk 5) TaxID=368408 RepID=EF1B_THEPD|nr:elongation factor 1-beta [Thermofilum pendens]A1RXY3.1 RecName: Full=Elongation factor 1-beta; Short=EF-1-beta; AltName: Full=aEF-1beta [Thermofilum pendens Hrk 5]ABL78063.1 translation elongation factor 1B (aEF-1B) [Thermofilum pendens Hrk 5]